MLIYDGKYHYEGSKVDVKYRVYFGDITICICYFRRYAIQICDALNAIRP